MFFNKKEKKIDDQFSSYQDREKSRYNTQAGFMVEGFEGEGLLKNVSIPGLCLESVTYVSVTPKEQYKIKIIPEPISHIESFELRAEVNWVRSTELSFEAGFSIINPSQDKTSPIRRYVEFLKIHNR
ncbi:MAG: PilZ domain-containing protein [Treponema sp.]|jgi:hypothetical protein|nr:PilZ domain-containing protein [Treponema sp.]